MGPAPTVAPVAHARPAEGEAQELLGFGRVMFLMRLVGFAFVLSQVPFYANVSYPLVALALALLVGAMAGQRAGLPDGLPLARIRRRSIVLLLVDMVAVYVVGTAFVGDPGWIGFYFYPLLALEAAVVAGLRGGLAVTITSVLVYLGQVSMHASLGYVVTPQEVMGAVALIGLTGGFTVVFGLTALRGEQDVRVLLDLTTALAHQRDEAETIELLNRRLHDAVGAHVRSVAIRNADGRFELIRWHSTERRTLDRERLEPVLGDVDGLAVRFQAGTALTWDVEAFPPIAAALGLPGWTRSVTLVPIFIEGRWIGVLPVLWPSRTIPDGRQLRLVYGLANQMGLALTQGQLQRVREEAATDSLTGLMNRRAILDELAAAIARAARSDAPVSILFCDLDAFKAVNDTRGHEAGDEVLRLIAQGVRSSLRQGDVVGRYGGDELLVIAAGADARDAATLAGRVGAAVRDVAGPQGVDVTIGISLYPSDGRSASDLLAAADRAMYRGKLHGTGNVVLASAAEGDEALAGRA